jgi:hypothetical protein
MIKETENKTSKNTPMPLEIYSGYIRNAAVKAAISEIVKRKAFALACNNVFVF